MGDLVSPAVRHLGEEQVFARLLHVPLFQPTNAVRGWRRRGDAQVLLPRGSGLLGAGSGSPHVGRTMSTRHQSPPIQSLSLEAAQPLLVTLFPGPQWNMPVEQSRRHCSPLCCWGAEKQGRRRWGPLRVPACHPGKDLLPWLCLGHRLLGIMIHPPRLSKLPQEIHL